MQRATAREWTGLAVLALACLLYVMDLTVLNIAVPAISEDLRPSSTQLLWIIDSYGFMVAGALVTMGTLGDRIGRRRLLMIGAAAFGITSVLAAFSTSPEMLIAIAGAAGHRRGDDRPVDAVADLPHVHRPEAAVGGRRDLDRRLLRGQRGRPGARRADAGALLVGLGVPAGAAGDGGAARARPEAAARVPRSRRRPAGRGQRRDVDRRTARDRLRAQADGHARCRRGERRGRRCGRRRRDAVGAPAAQAAPTR